MRDNGPATITRVAHSMGSGIATVYLRDDDDNEIPVHVEAGSFFRAIQDLPGDAPIIGRRVTYSMTDFGTMSAFSLED